MSRKDCLDIIPEFYNKKIKASFSLKNFSYLNNDGRSLFAKINGYNFKNLIIPEQRHSINVSFCHNARTISNCDGVFTNNIQNACSIQVADCMPIFFGHCRLPVFGVVHAGWRGLVNGILIATSNLLLKRDYNLSDFEVIIGPSIQKCCFEVKDDILINFNKNFIRYSINNVTKIDLQGHAIHDLINIGFDKDKIIKMGECTFCEKDRFHSYRRDGSNSGRMFGIIGFNQ